MFSMLVLSPVAATTTDVKATVVENSGYTEVTVPTNKEKAQILNPDSVKAIINATFPDNPIMAKIAFCESGLKQFNDDGSIMRGWMTPADVGVMQINEGYHGERAKALGINIYTIEGNLKYAGLLYNEQGTQPWSASKPCWSKM